MNIWEAIGPKKKTTFNDKFDTSKEVGEGNQPYNVEQPTFFDRLLRPGNVQTANQGNAANDMAAGKFGSMTGSIPNPNFRPDQPPGPNNMPFINPQQNNTFGQFGQQSQTGLIQALMGLLQQR